VFIQNNSTLSIALLSSPILYVTERITAILEVEFLKNSIPQLPMLIYFLNKMGQVKSVHSDSLTTTLLASNPCAFTDTPTAKKVGTQYLIWSADGQLCLCQHNFTDCQLATTTQAANTLQNSRHLT
jgi:hypothetical protein